MKQPRTDAPLSVGRALLHLGLALLALLATLALCPALGGSALDMGRAWSEGMEGSSEDAVIFWQLRLPRVLLAALAGASLAVAGTAFQALLRNDLATPYTLGVAGGASLGATLVVLTGLELTVLGFSPVTAAAFVGALLSVVVVYAVARALGSLSGTTLLLAGITWSMACSSVVLLMQYLSDPTATFLIVRWLMGGLEVVGYREVIQTVPFVMLGGIMLLWLAPALNLMAVDGTLAASRGVDVDRVRKVTFVSASLITGAVMSQTGPIAFVGLIVPHAVRRIVGVDNRLLMPASMVYGAVFLCWADTLARGIAAPDDLPVGIVTALLGAPFLLVLLMRGRRL